MFSEFNETFAVVVVGTVDCLNNAAVFDELDAFEVIESFGIFANGPSVSTSFTTFSFLLSFFKIVDDDEDPTDRKLCLATFSTFSVGLFCENNPLFIVVLIGETIEISSDIPCFFNLCVFKK